MMTQTKATFDRITRPNQSLDARDQDQSRLLLIFIFLFIVFGSLYAVAKIVLIVATDSAESLEQSISGALFSALLFAIVFGVAKTKYYRVAIILAFVTFDVMLLLSFAQESTRFALILLMAIPIMISAYLATFRGVVVVMLVQLGLVMVTSAALQKTVFGGQAGAYLFGVTFFGGVAIITAYVRTERERMDRAEIVLINRQLDELRVELEDRVEQQTAQLVATNALLKEENAGRVQTERALRTQTRSSTAAL